MKSKTYFFLTCMGLSKKNEIKRLLKEQLSYNVSIKKSKIKLLNNVDMLSEYSFYHKLNIVKTAKAFKRYTRNYSIKIIKDKDENTGDPLAQLEVSKAVIKDLFRDLLIEMNCFKCQTAMKFLLCKQKENGGT